jgi:hypothetical protein
MTLFTSIENVFETAPTVTDTFVLNLISNVKNGIALVESDLQAANKWIVANASTITADIQSVLGIVEVVGVAVPTLSPAVTAAVTAANAAVARAQHLRCRRIERNQLGERSYRRLQRCEASDHRSRDRRSCGRSGPRDSGGCLMANVFDEMALAGKLADAAPGMIKHVQSIEADVHALVNDVEKNIMPKIKLILGHVDAIVATVATLFPPAVPPAAPKK